MKFLHSKTKIHTVKNFISYDDIEIVKENIFELKPYWKNILEFPTSNNKHKIFTKNNLYPVISELKRNIKNFDGDLVKNSIEFLKHNYPFFKPFLTEKSSIDRLSGSLKIIEETEEINDDVLNEIIGQIVGKDRCQNLLGDAIYLLCGKKECIDYEIQNKLKDEFQFLYNRLIESLEKTFGRKVDFDKILPCPGFHIFGPCEYKNLEFDYHQDVSVLDFYPNVDLNTVYSYVTLIQKPLDDPFLDFDGGKQIYEYTNLYLWKGLMTHRIGNFSLEPNEYRITFQGHLFFDKHSGIIRIFF